MGVHVKVAGAWKQIGLDTSNGALGGWAKVTGGTVTEVTNADGSVDEVHKFTANGTLTVESPGYARVLLVSGGSGACSTGGYEAHGGAGDVIHGHFILPVGSHAVTVGAGGVKAGDYSRFGKQSSIGTGLVTGWGRMSSGLSTVAEVTDGRAFDISGASVVYGKAAQPAVTANTGDGGNINGNIPGSSGIVIVRVQKSAPTTSGVVASGGTVTTYTGDGTNGVLGQNYKVHTFTANGSFTVTQGGIADVLVVASGGGGSGKGDGIGGSGGGGGVLYVTDMNVAAGTHNVIVGAAIPANTQPYAGTQGNPSQFDGLYAYGGGGGGFEDNPGGFGGSGGGGGGGNNIKPGGAAVSGQGYAGGTAPTLFSSGGAGGAGGAGSGTTPGPGRTLYITGSAVAYGKGGVDGTAGTLPGQGGGSYEGPGNGTAFASAAGTVIIRYKV